MRLRVGDILGLVDLANLITYKHFTSMSAADPGEIGETLGDPLLALSCPGGSGAVHSASRVRRAEWRRPAQDAAHWHTWKDNIL